MASFWLHLRADIRVRWRAMASLTLLLGVFGGVILAATAGAVRTDTAYPRLLRWGNASQIEVVPGNPDLAYIAALARLPQVAAESSSIQYTLSLPGPNGKPDPNPNIAALSSPDDSLGVSVDRVKILRGQMFGRDQAGQAVIDPQLASREHLRVGSTLRLIAIPYLPRRRRRRPRPR